jgi:hypothetical protein|tara:strand:- start:1488 stop:1781 length:294 start_codon:yes stop_codon:yes gene_type:complete
MNKAPTAEDIELLLKKMQTDGGGVNPMEMPEFVADTIDEVGYDPDIGPIDIGASPDNLGATRGLPPTQIGASPDNLGATRGLTPEHLEMIMRLIGQR